MDDMDGMDGMDGVRRFFSFFLEAREKEKDAVPVYDLQVEFRVNRESEVKGNQIIRWRFEVGGEEIQPGDVDPPARWAFGQPVRLLLDWADNAPTRPLDPKVAGARLAGKTVIFEYENAWSLVSLLQQHAAAPADFAAYADARPETLVFRIPAGEIVGEAFDDEGRQIVRLADYFTVKVFLRITTLTPDGGKVAVPFPATFPVVAPPFPEPSAAAADQASD